MKGYKVAFHEERIQGTDVINGLHYSTTIDKIPVLVVLDIPDNAQTSTPEGRYTEENIGKIQARWGTRFFDPQRYMPPYVDAALKEYAAYNAYKNEEPLTIYNEFFNDYCAGLSEYIHCTKCRCNEAKVIDIVGIFTGMHYTHAVSMFDPHFGYALGKTVSCEDFGTYSLMAVCAPGIHYFKYPVFAILYMVEGTEFFTDAVRDGKIDSRVVEKYLTEELNTLKREDKAIEYCKADVSVTERLFEESLRNSAYGLSIPSGKDEDNEE